MPGFTEITKQYMCFSLFRPGQGKVRNQNRFGGLSCINLLASDRQKTTQPAEQSPEKYV